MNDHRDLLAVAFEAVDLGQKLLATMPPGTISDKHDRDIVTDLDLHIQHEMQAHLQRATPHFAFLGEEHGGGVIDENTEYVWALDPIDGTSNFAHGLPLCATSLALVHHGEPVVAVIHAPFLDLRYHATKNGGAYRNGQPIHASNTTQLNRAIVSLGDYATGTNAAKKNRRRFAVTQALADNVERVRMFGAASLDLTWVAEGRTDACIMLNNKPWDTGAGVLIAREAGANVIASTGNTHTFESHDTIACTPAITEQFLAIINSTNH
ncbi:myo-inositol-1(or 4)-monophosphatase [Tamaricihabitans halophyticus]|uniref:Myo-inositol-1(Or 4)-monophosphatase n=1 Tax=Tamaricihabitans halophyticus TaxID=1262583 RepID=A0A4V2SV07_9PSEU|nr:inositol monophosphatase family protein [Tamaricihabitans halophyticus]TCP56676.1 myo-inositol-1(or 4)-monophosphatase [Tamaricihabitans halophyticus]